MTDWEKHKVTDLKEECKSRKISITGLKLKQHFIDKLVEYESNSQEADAAEESVESETNGAFEEVVKDDVPEKSPAHAEPGPDTKHEESGDAIEDTPVVAEADKNIPDRPPVLNAEVRRASEVEEQEDAPMADTTLEAKDIQKNDMSTPEPGQLQVAQGAHPVEDLKEQDVAMDDAEAQLRDAVRELTPTPIVDQKDAVVQDTAPTEDPETRKRKRRSVTPPPIADEIQKKVKAANGEPVVIRRTRSPSPVSSPKRTRSNDQTPMEEVVATDGKAAQIEDSDIVAERKYEESTKQEQPRRQTRSPSVDKHETTELALHAATRSLYMRNFKRPINVQSLRAHVLAIAQGSSSVARNQDPITYWHMNNVRSHAFVTLTSISAASRVRAAMHQTRFPDEPQRDPLFVDFVPDDKVEGWVEQEAGGSRALGRNSGSKLEVIYRDTGDGYEAVFEEAGSSRSQPARPSISTSAHNRSSLSQRYASYAADSTKTTSIASGIHPDRAGLVPRSPEQDRRRPLAQTLPEPQKRQSDQGTGFKALDDLFESTTVKPKLYYKLPPRSVIDDRLDTIRGIYSDRGVSGDPGMKRYTFEKDGSREEWVDNGPEFGHGRKGLDRLNGIAPRGRGGFRGRGGGRGFYGGDSYRGGGRR